MEHVGTGEMVYSAGFNQLEWQKHPESDALLAWDLFAYAGNDNSRWWLKSEGAVSREGSEEAYAQLTYSQPVSPFWDLQFGLRSRSGPGQQNFLLVGLYGLAPGFVDVDTYLLLNSEGDAIWQLEADYELRLARHWLLLTDAELLANAQNDEATLSGSGLAQAEFGVRLAWELLRKLQPYAGIEWERSFGQTREYREKADEAAREWRAVAGFSFWY